MIIIGINAKLTIPSLNQVYLLFASEGFYFVSSPRLLEEGKEGVAGKLSI